jgi:hypothetical protein
MAVGFCGIKPGSEWERKELAKLWGYRSFHALGRGVFTPRGGSQIILFVTDEKQESATQYQDRLDGKELRWEGEEGHRSDQRIIGAAKNGDVIHIFYRKRHHQPFTYLGTGQVKKAVEFTDKPSGFVFSIHG